MYMVKYGAVIGLKEPIAWKFITGHIQKNALLDQSQRCIYP
jgi:hypothetical protein